MRSPTTQAFLALALLALTVVGYGVWYATVSASSAQAANLETQIESKTQAENRVAAARATLDEIASEESIVDGYFVSQAGVVSFISALESLGTTLGTKVTILSVSTGGTKNQPQLIIVLSAEGSFSAVMRTVGTIEFAPYDLTLAGLAVRKNPTGDWTASLTITLGSTVSNQPSGSAPAPVIPAATSTSSVFQPLPNPQAS